MIINYSDLLQSAFFIMKVCIVASLVILSLPFLFFVVLAMFDRIVGFFKSGGFNK